MRQYLDFVRGTKVAMSLVSVQNSQPRLSLNSLRLSISVSRYLHVVSYMNHCERIITSDHDALQIEISNHVDTHKEGRLTRCEESANILSVSIASALSEQRKTKNPAMCVVQLVHGDVYHEILLGQCHACIDPSEKIA